MSQARRIEVGELEELMRAGPVTILDLRRGWDEATEQVPGAIRVDPDRFETWTDLRRGRPIVTYCT